METEEQIKRYKHSTAESFVSLSIGLWTVSLIGYLNSGISWATYFLGITGVISALLSIYPVMPLNRSLNQRRKSVLKFLDTNKIIRIVKLLIWLIVIATFGAGLIQTKVIWLILTGLISIIIAPVVFSVGLWRMNKDNGKKKHA